MIDRDNGKIWGWYNDGEFRPLSKALLLSAELGPPPFNVTLMSGEIRSIVNAPEAFVIAEPELDPLTAILEHPPEPEIPEPRDVREALAERLKDFAALA